MSSKEAQLYREFARAAAVGGPEAQAAATALVATGAEQVEDWTALFALVARQSRWEEALPIAHLAVERHPTSPAAALLVPTALLELKRFEAARAEFKALAAAHPDDFEASDRLASMAWQRGYPPGALARVEDALTRGLRGRDHIIQIGTSSATLMGRFDRARSLSDHFVDPELRRSTLEKITVADGEWKAAATALDDQYAGQASVPAIERMLEEEQHELIRHAAVRLLTGGDVSARALEFLVHRTDPLGPPGWFISQWARYEGARRFPEDPAFLWSEAGVLLQRGAFEDAGRLLLRLVDSNVQPELLLRWMTFAAAGGGLSGEQLRGAATRAAARGSREGAYQLVLSFLDERRSPAALDFSRLDAPGERLGASSLSVSARGGQLRRFYRTPRLRRPRIAVCVSGQLRSFRRTWPGSRSALAEWDTTVFVSTWRDTGAGIGMHDSADRLLPSAVQQRLPLSLRRRTIFEDRLPKVFSAMIQSSSVSREELTETFGTPFIRVQDESQFERSHCHGRPGLENLGSYNQAKMFFTMADANTMKSEFEIENGWIFDAVLRLRPDRQLTRLGQADLERVIDERTVLSDYLHPAGVGDQVLLSSSEVADVYGDIWPRLDACGSPAYFAGNSGRFSEDLLAEHVMAHGVGVGLFSSTQAEWLSAEVGSVSALWSALQEDLAGPLRRDRETRAIIRAFIESAAEDASSSRGEYHRGDAGALERWDVLEGLSDRAKAFIHPAQNGDGDGRP